MRATRKESRMPEKCQGAHLELNFTLVGTMSQILEWLRMKLERENHDNKE